MMKYLNKMSPFLLHLMVIYSVFDIYFKSPILQIKEPSSPQHQAAARRLVVFVADGLRAQSFYEARAAPFLHQTGIRQGVVGISHTQVPTESRPGHVALLAGIYEDPAAITKGWSENPVDFDSVLNRSTYTWAWGSPDILPIFSKGNDRKNIHLNMYDASLEDFGAKDSSHLDTWVFDKVERFFESAIENSDLQLKLREQGNIFFLHLLGCDTNGHTNKPGSVEYKENILVVDAGVDRVVQSIERYYREDRHTAYIFTADHGMTDWGSHGTGMDEETMTPFIAWGAGIKHKHQDISLSEILGENFQTFLANKNKVDVRQADITPLISTLLGNKIPVNSIGLLPHNILDLHPRELSLALKGQYSQLLVQYEELKSVPERGYFPTLFHKQYPGFTQNNIQDCERTIDRLISSGQYNQSINTISACIEKTFSGITYYQRYQENILRVLISISLILSLLFNAVLFLQLFSGLDKLTGPSCSKFNTMNMLLLLLCIFSWWCQQLPLHFLFYYTAPVYMLTQLLGQLNTSNQSIKLNREVVLILLFTVLICESVVFSFFDRRCLALGVGLIATSFLFRRRNLVPGLSILLAGGFSWFPAIDGRTENAELVLFSSLLYSCAVIWILKDSSNSYLKILLTASNFGSGLCVFFSNNSEGLSDLVQCTSWIIFVLTVPASILLTTDFQERLIGVMLALGANYTLLSLYYENIFLLTISLSIYSWIQAESDQSTAGDKVNGRRESKTDDVLYITRFFFLVFYSFFATGNIASLNSFDPRSIRCFVSVFNPFLMGGLLFIKILIPILNTGILFSGLIKIRGMNKDLVFSLLHLFTDILSLHFFHLVRNTGSWLQIGSSLSHFIIVEGTSVFLLVLLRLSENMLSLGTRTKFRIE